jgi:hypothetical protein
MSDEHRNPLMDGVVEKLLQGLVRQGIDREKADALVHALVDIEESVRKIYVDLVPELVRSLDESPDKFKEKLWDIREEFRHVPYHIEDAGLVDL